MKAITTLIIDDQRDAIQNLLKLLEAFNEIEVIGTACDVDTGVCNILKLQPGLIFLDVEMPPKTGFDLIHDLNQAVINMPGVIFTTAYDKYAIQALKSNAFDYLLKPIDPKELAVAINKFCKSLQENPLRTNYTLNHSVKNKRIMIPTIIGIKNVEVSAILYIEKLQENADQIKIVYSETEWDNIPGCYTLKQIAEIIQDNDFFQTDRNTIINLAYLKEIETKGRLCYLNKNGYMVVKTISRGRLKALRGQQNLL